MLIAVVGGGVSGLLSAVHLLRSVDGVDVALFEPGRPGEGKAYSTRDPQHLLNVRARDMSAFPDDPAHFAEWAAQHVPGAGPADFLPRMRYADYLRDCLAAVADQRLTIHRERVVELRPAPSGGHRLHTTSGAVVDADLVVLAYGNLAPRPLSVAGRPLPAAPWHRADPWAPAGGWPRGRLLLVGSGLTAVDVTLSALAEDPDREVVMVSRTGELPRAHVEQSSTAWVTPLPEGPVDADQLAALVRGQIDAARERGVDWRAVIDGLRAPTQDLWQRMDLDQKRRFLDRHARAWEVHRHRMAPEVAAQIRAHRESGRLVPLGGGLAGVEDLGARCRVRIGTPDGSAGPVIEADALVNCTGPRPDVVGTGDPLVGSLLRQGLVAPHPLGLGLATTPAGGLLGDGGVPTPGLLAVGPPRRGTLYESTAVPEIRGQAAALAAHVVELLSSGPVGGALASLDR